MTSFAFDDPGIAELYDAASNERLDFTYCRALAQDAASVLDLGCGTGAFLSDLPTGVRRVGVDPAQAMLDIAAARPGGANCDWVCADAQTARLDRTFDLIVLTGHTFQVFLSDADQSRALDTIAAHLAPGGHFILDTRNPQHPARKERKLDEAPRSFDHPELGLVTATNASTYDAATGLLSYENHYHLRDSDARRSIHTQIRYTSRDDLAQRIAAAGLAVERWLGDWHDSAFQPQSPEIIPLGHLA